MFKPQKKLQATFSGLTGGDSFKDAGVILPISACILNSNQEGERFEATLEGLGNNGVIDVKIVIADTLYRHTLVIEKGQSKEELIRRTKEQGLAWYERNKEIIKKIQDTFPIKIEVIHWDQCLEDEDYPRYRKTLDKEFQIKESPLRLALQQTAMGFLLKNKDQQGKIFIADEPTLDEPFFQNIEYLKEEGAVIKQWEKYNSQYIVYMTKATSAIVASMKFFESKLKFIALKFKGQAAQEKNDKTYQQKIKPAESVEKESYQPESKSNYETPYNPDNKNTHLISEIGAKVFRELLILKDPDCFSVELAALYIKKLSERLDRGNNTLDEGNNTVEGNIYGGDGRPPVVFEGNGKLWFFNQREISLSASSDSESPDHSRRGSRSNSFNKSSASSELRPFASVELPQAFPPVDDNKNGENNVSEGSESALMASIEAPRIVQPK